MLFIPVFFSFLALGVGSIVIAVMTAADASKYPDWAFQQTGSTKFVWQILPIVLLFLCGIAGGVMGLIWFTSKRDAVARAASAGGPSPYGYGTLPASGGWTAPPAPPYPPPPPPPAPPPPPDAPQ